jgi:PhzF family phenazine biosynthesis protein
MRVPLTLVDAFTDTPFAGNPAAVCLLEAPRDDGWMQAVAAEMNLPATAFVRAAGDGFEIRWFTATTELELCGHGTLAAAHVLWESGRVAPEAVARFQTPSGRLSAARREGWIELDFPAAPASVEEAPTDLIASLGVSAKWTGRNRLDWLVEVESASVVRAVAPDLARLGAVPTRGVIVTAPADDTRADFVSRFFAPRAGIPEDHVTGSAHCCLGPYWAARLGREALTGHQASPRGGFVRVRSAGERVILGGRAVTVLRGELA